MTTRETQRIVRRALRQTGLSPEAFAAEYRGPLYGTSARTVRRWADGETKPHGAIVTYLLNTWPVTRADA